LSRPRDKIGKFVCDLGKFVRDLVAGNCGAQQACKFARDLAAGKSGAQQACKFVRDLVSTANENSSKSALENSPKRVRIDPPRGAAAYQVIRA